MSRFGFIDPTARTDRDGKAKKKINRKTDYKQYWKRNFIFFVPFYSPFEEKNMVRGMHESFANKYVHTVWENGDNPCHHYIKNIHTRLT